MSGFVDVVPEGAEYHWFRFDTVKRGYEEVVPIQQQRARLSTNARRKSSRLSLWEFT